MALKRRTEHPAKLPVFGKLASYLARHKLSQEEFAERSGLDRITVLRLVNGDRAWVNCDLAAAIEIATEGEITFLDCLNEAPRRRLAAFRKRAA